MGLRFPRVERLVWVGMGITSACLLLACLLGILRIRAGYGQPLPVYGTVEDFNLTNQNAQPVSLESLRGHVWVADVIFTRCPGPCLKMTRQMKELEQALPRNTNTRLVTLTTDPDFDSPAVLKTYAQRFGADFRHWMFLTGTKKQIVDLAIDSLKLTALEKKPEDRTSPNDLFVHSTIFVLVDKHAQLRGVFQTTGEGVDPLQVKSQILTGVRRLEREG